MSTCVHNESTLYKHYTKYYKNNNMKQVNKVELC